MRIVVGAFSMAQPGGTETYVLTVTRELERLGHQVAIATMELGPLAEQARRDGFVVQDDFDQLPERCDAIFAQDAILGAELKARYPGTRLIHFAHSPIFDHQLPILLAGAVAAVVVASDLMADRIRALSLAAPIVRLRHPIDTDTFRAGPIHVRPRRALLLSNYLRGARRRALTDAWEAAGVECVQIGEPTRPEFNVAPAIAQADIVVAKARAALEGMSCGRAVYVYDESAGDGWVTPDNYAELEASNFSGLATERPRGPRELAVDLANYNADMGWQNRELAIAHHSSRRHAAQIVEILRGPDGRAERGLSVAGEISRLGRAALHARRHAAATERELQRVRMELDAWRDRATAAEVELSRARGLLATKRARIGLAAGRALDRMRGRT